MVNPINQKKKLTFFLMGCGILFLSLLGLVIFVRTKLLSQIEERADYVAHTQARSSVLAIHTLLENWYPQGKFCLPSSKQDPPVNPDSLHQRLSKIEILNIAYVTIISPTRGYLYHPDENQLHQPPHDSLHHYLHEVEKRQLPFTQERFSHYLHLDVVTYFQPIVFCGEQCIITGNAPDLGFEDFISQLEQLLFWTSILIFILFAIIAYVGFRGWKDAFIHSERQKKQAILTEMESIKQGLKPHFLFNSLSSLIVLIKRYPDQAVTFTRSLSDTYRYLLEQGGETCVTLTQELAFTQHYIEIQQIRFQNRIEVEYSLPESALNSLVPPISLQTLVENCIKHNAITAEQPLPIQISIQDNYLVVKNQMQPLLFPAPSSGKGLKSLALRYSLLTTKPCFFEAIEGWFVAKIPLLHSPR